MSDADLTSRSLGTLPNPIAITVNNDRWWGKLFVVEGLKIKLFLGATLVGSAFSFFLCVLRLLTDAHLQQIDVTNRYALARYAYTLSEQVHFDLLEMIVVSYALVYTTTLLLYPFVLLQQNVLKNQALDNMRARAETLIMLGNTIAKRDSDTSAHNYRVTLYAIHLASALALSDTDLLDLIAGAFLHDIGKIAIPDKILLKPGPLNEEEAKIMQTHVTQGLDILQHNFFLHGACAVVGSHHEHYIGTGYPNGLVGLSIPPTARLFSIVDVFDALTSRRPYKPPFSLDKSLKLMAEESGRAFDPAYLHTFMQLAPELYRMYATASEEFLYRELAKLVRPIFIGQFNRY